MAVTLEEPRPQSMAPGLGTVSGAPTDADSAAKPADPTPATPAPATPKAEPAKPAPADAPKDLSAYPGAIPVEETKSTEAQVAAQPELKDDISDYPGAVKDPELAKMQAQAEAFKKQQQAGQPAGSQPGAAQPKEIGQPQPQPQPAQQPPKDDFSAYPGAIPAETPPAVVPAPTPQPATPSIPPPRDPGTVAQDQGSDPQDRIATLVSQGLPLGQAQAMVAGQVPKTLSGNTLPPPPLPPQPPQAVVPQAPQTTKEIAAPLINGQAPIGSNLPSTSTLPDTQPTDAAPKAATQDAPTGPITKNPNGADLPQRVQAVGGVDPAAFIVHHTSGRSTVQGVIDTLRQRHLGVEYVMDRDGNIFNTGGPGSANILPGWGQGAGLNNRNIVGMEIIASNNKDVLDVQKQAFARFIAARYPTTPLFGHGEVNPGHKEPDEGLAAKYAALEFRNSGGTAYGKPDPNAGVVDLINKAGINATRFGYTGDPFLDPESKAGHGKYVENMKPGYDVALNAKSAAMVGNPKPGEEFEFAGRKWRYGDKVPEKYPDPRFDIYDPNNEFGDIGGLGSGGGNKGGSGRSGAPAAPGGQPWGQPGGGLAGQPLFSIPTAGGGSTASQAQPQQARFGDGNIGGPPSSRSEAPVSQDGGSLGGGGVWFSGGGGGGGGGSQDPQPQRQQMSASAPPPDEPQQQQNPVVQALMQRGFTPQQAASFLAIAPGKGVPALPPPAPGALPTFPALPASQAQKQLQPVQTKLMSPKQLMPGKVPPIVPKGPPPAAPSSPASAQPSQAVDPTVVLGLMKRGFTREQAIATAGKATVTKGIGDASSFRPPPAAPAAPAPPAKPTPQQIQQAKQPPPGKPANDLPRQAQQAPVREPQQFSRPPGSTHGLPNLPGVEAINPKAKLTEQAKQHASLVSPDDPRVKKQADGYIKGEHFVEGDPFHDQLLSGLPYGKQGHQRGLLGQAETAIADKSPMHISYISAPKEAAKFPTRDTRKIQYDEHSPEARLMGTTEGQLVGHSFIPLNVGIKTGAKGEPHQSYVQGISTNVLANNFQHLTDKLTGMGRKSPYEKLGPKFYNDLEGYYSNLNAGHTATGRGYTVGTADHPNEPDREHVPYKLSRKEADFIGTVINNTAAFAKHEDAKKIRELARANGTLITEKGETNRLRHDIEEHEPGWRERVLEPSIRSFKTGLIHEIHPSEEHFPETIRPGNEYQGLTKSIARTSERGRPDIPIAASLHHNFADNKAINAIERDFSEHKIDEAEAKARIKAMGEDPDEFKFVGGSGGLVSPYEDDGESLSPEEHNQMKSNLKSQWVGGKLGVDDYRKKVAEIPLPTKPSKPVKTAAEPGIAPSSTLAKSAPSLAMPGHTVPSQAKPREDLSTASSPETVTPAPKSKPPKAPKPATDESEGPTGNTGPVGTTGTNTDAPGPDDPLPEKKPEPTSASQYVSPNVKEGTDLTGAQKQVGSKEHKQARDFYQRVEDTYRPGKKGGEVKPTIGNWEGTQEGSTLTHDDNDNLEDARTKAALKGLHSAQKGTAAFHYHDDGPDRHYDIDFPNHPHEHVDKLIAKHGFSASTVYKAPDGLRAHLIDPGGQNYEHALKLAKEAGSQSPIAKRGTAAFDGGDDRDAAAESYRRVLGERGIQVRQGPGSKPLRGGQHPLQPLYEEAEKSFARHQGVAFSAPGPGDPLPAKPRAKKAPVAEEKLTKPAGATLNGKPNRAWMEDPKNEAERQGYLEKRVAASLKRQNKHSSSIPLKAERNEAGGVQYDPQLNPTWEKTDYDIANNPFLRSKKKTLNQLKNADKHEDTLDPNEHKHLNDVQRKRLSAMREASSVHTMGDHIFESYNKIKDQPDIAAGKGWYSRMREKMAKVFGVGEGGKASDDHELFAQLLGATSAKTPVRDNFIQALDAFEQHKAGKFKRHVDLYNEAYDALQSGGYEALNQKMREQGILKEGDKEPEPKTDENAMARWVDHHQITPLKQNGAKYNSNSDQVLKVLAGKWLSQVGAPKTPNFAGNLTGRTLAATIDVWAARHLHRIGTEFAGEKKKWRPQSMAEPGVNDLDFAFSQDAMKHAADKAGINPDDLQAILWYAEKHHWDEKGWTGAQGADKGSFDETWDRAFPAEGKAMTSEELRGHYQGEKERDDKLDTLRTTLAGKKDRGEDPKKIENYLKRYADEFLGKHGMNRSHLEAPAAPGLEEAA